MMIGDGVKKLEKRMAAALCSGSLKGKEPIFLQEILRRIELYRENAYVSDAQAGWLFTILTRVEQGATDRNKARRRKPTNAPLCSFSDNPAKCLNLKQAGLDNVVWPEEEKPESFDISQAIERGY
jgi:hypothetical protein